MFFSDCIFRTSLFLENCKSYHWPFKYKYYFMLLLILKGRETFLKDLYTTFSKWNHQGKYNPHIWKCRIHRWNEHPLPSQVGLMGSPPAPLCHLILVCKMSSFFSVLCYSMFCSRCNPAEQDPPLIFFTCLKKYSLVFDYIRILLYQLSFQHSFLTELYGYATEIQGTWVLTNWFTEFFFEIKAYKILAIQQW